MSAYVNVAVPFVRIGNRRGLMDRQICEFPWLGEFIARWPNSFERDELRCVWMFIEP